MLGQAEREQRELTLKQPRIQRDERPSSVSTLDNERRGEMLGALMPWLEREFLSQRNQHGGALPDSPLVDSKRVQLITVSFKQLPCVQATTLTLRSTGDRYYHREWRGTRLD